MSPSAPLAPADPSGPSPPLRAAAAEALARVRAYCDEVFQAGWLCRQIDLRLSPAAPEIRLLLKDRASAPASPAPGEPAAASDAALWARVVISSTLADSLHRWRRGSSGLSASAARFPGLLDTCAGASSCDLPAVARWSQAPAAACAHPPEPWPAPEPPEWATWESFVTAPSNARAHALCWEVATRRSRGPSLVVLHGTGCVGKSHLLGAVARQFHGDSAEPPGGESNTLGGGAGILHGTGLDFVAEHARQESAGALDRWRTRYREARVVLLDDAQSLARDPRAQAEFSEILRRRAAIGSPVIVALDRAPQEASLSDPHLRRYLRYGAVAGIAQATLETRAEILRRRAKALQVAVPATIIAILAECFSNDMRSAIEALPCAGVSIAPGGSEPGDDDLATCSLAAFAGERPRAVSLDTIRDTVSEYLAVRPSDLFGRRRDASIAFARHVAIFLARKYTSRSLSEIGRYFGGRDASTALYACRRIKQDVRSLRVVQALEKDLAG